MIRLKSAARAIQKDARGAEPLVREILAPIKKNGEDAPRNVTFAFFML